MELTLFRRTALVILLVAIPWFLVGVFSFAFLMQAHLQEGMTYSSGMRASIIVGGVMCIFALAIFADGVKKGQINLLLIIFALSGLWYLIEWPAKALLGILRS